MIQREVATSDGGDDRVRVPDPSEGARVAVGLLDEAVDRGLERDEGAERPAPKRPPSELGEETLDGVEPAG